MSLSSPALPLTRPGRPSPPVPSEAPPLRRRARRRPRPSGTAGCQTATPGLRFPSVLHSHTYAAHVAGLLGEAIYPTPQVRGRRTHSWLPVPAAAFSLPGVSPPTFPVATAQQLRWPHPPTTPCVLRFYLNRSPCAPNSGAGNARVDTSAAFSVFCLLLPCSLDSRLCGTVVKSAGCGQTPGSAARLWVTP